LSFSLEGQIPLGGADPKAIVLPDGRTAILSNQYPDAIDDLIVYGPQSFFVSNNKAGIAGLPGSGFPKPFQSTAIEITGVVAGPVTLQAVSGSPNCTNCSFHPEYYSFSPPTGTPPFTTIVRYNNPAGNVDNDLYVHAASTSGGTAVGGVQCMTLTLRASNDVFGQHGETALPMNTMNLALSGAVPVTQTNNILSLGGRGYPFTVTSSVPWVTVSPANGTAPLPLSVTVDPTTLKPGAYSGVLTLSAEGTTQKITVNATVTAGLPIVTSVGNAASGTPTIAPNSFVSIYGSGFAPTATTWAPTTSLPTTLAGVSVRVNSQSAYISYADPTQINVLLPPDSATGLVPVEVTTPTGVTTTTANMATTVPGWFTYSVNNSTYIAALFANTATYVAPSGSLGGISSRSAKPGDYLQLYVNGLGATNPAPPTGVVLTTAYQLDDYSRLTVTIAGQPVPVLYAGLVYSGLYQVNLQVPQNIGIGDLPIVLVVNGVPTQGATLNVQQ